MKQEKYFDLTETGVQFDISKYLAEGWRITYSGTTLIIMERGEINVI